MTAASVQSCSTVTTFPPARAGSATGRRNSHEPANASAATMSRASTPTTSMACKPPARQAVANATAMKSLSATGSRIGPAREPPSRRASIPSNKSAGAADRVITPLQRSALPLLCAALAGCFDAGPSGFATVLLDPILDSVFVGDQIPPPSVTYFDRAGNAHTPTSGSIRWGSTDTTVISVDPSTGTITGKKRGLALVSAEVQGVMGVALIAVSNTLDLTLLLEDRKSVV